MGYHRRMLSTNSRSKLSNTLDNGHFAWGVLVGYIVFWDIFAMKQGKSTLSTAFYLFSSSRAGKPALISFWFYLTAHLFRWIPKRYDLFRRFFG